MAVTQKRMTAGELLKLPRGKVRYELVKGELVEMTPADHRHGRIAMNISISLGTAVEQQKLGAVYAAETGFYLQRDPDTVRAPDLAFVRRERLDEADEQGYFPGAPDLAVEVISPSDVYQEVEAKVAEWFAAGSAAVVVVNPRNWTVKHYSSVTELKVLTEEGVLELPGLIPGWRLPVAEIFEFGLWPYRIGTSPKKLMTLLSNSFLPSSMVKDVVSIISRPSTSACPRR